ncbi:hypothetical protein CF326_g7673 [Tilletia indica]|nr:hypothetical protein CF326_g7673 [Tilletia indica]
MPPAVITSSGVSGSSQPNSGGGSGSSSVGKSKSYTNTYDDRERSMSQPARCLWVLKKSGTKEFRCERSYPTLEHLHRHVEHAHFPKEETPPPEQGEGSPHASTALRKKKLHWKQSKYICRWDKNDCKRLSDRNRLTAHVKENHFDRFKYACAYEGCALFNFERKVDRNAHHAQAHRHSDGEDDDRRRMRLRPGRVKDEKGKAKEENGCQPSFAELYPALYDTLKKNPALGFKPLGKDKPLKESDDPFSKETIELPFWIECLTPIKMSNSEKPAQDKAIEDGRISPTRSDSSFSAIGGNGRLKRKAMSSQVYHAADYDEPSSDEVDDRDPSKKGTFENPYTFFRKDNPSIPVMLKRQVKLQRRADLTLHNIPTTKQIAAEKEEGSEPGPGGKKRWTRHPLMQLLQSSSDEGSDESSESDSSDDAISIVDTTRWLKGAKSDFQKRGLTVEQWRAEQRRLRILLFPGHPDIPAEQDDEKSSAGPSRLGMNSIKTSPTQSHITAGPSRLPLGQMNPIGRLASGSGLSLAALPSIPKRVVPPKNGLKKGLNGMGQPALVGAAGLAVPSPPRDQSRATEPRDGSVATPPRNGLPPIPKRPLPPPPTFSSQSDVEMADHSEDEDELDRAGINTSRLSATRHSPKANDLGPVKGSPSTSKGKGVVPPAAGPSTTATNSATTSKRPALFDKAKVTNPFNAIRKDKEEMERSLREKERQVAQKATLKELGRSRDDAIDISSSSDNENPPSPDRKRARVSSAGSAVPGPSSANDRRASLNTNGQKGSTAANGSSKAKKLFGPASVIHRRASAGRYGDVDNEAIQSVTGQRSSTPLEQGNRHGGPSSQSSDIFKALKDAVSKNDSAPRSSALPKPGLFNILARTGVPSTNNQARRRTMDDSDEEIDQLEDSQPAPPSQQSSRSHCQSPLQHFSPSPAETVASKSSTSPVKDPPRAPVPPQASAQRPTAKSMSPVKGPRSGQSAASPAKLGARAGQPTTPGSATSSRVTTIPEMLARAQNKSAASSARAPGPGLQSPNSVRPSGSGLPPKPFAAGGPSHRDATPLPPRPPSLPNKPPAALGSNGNHSRPAPQASSRAPAPADLIDLTMDSDSD